MGTEWSGYHGDLFGEARASEDFRRVLSTAKHVQLVLMTIPSGGEIGSEVHLGTDQILIAVEGSGVSVVDGAERSFQPGHVVAVPQGTRHNVVNTGPVPLRLVTVYGPPNHPPGTVHHTKSAADRDESDVPPEM